MLEDWLKKITYLCNRSTGIVLGVVALLSVIVFCSTSQGVRAYDTPAGYNEHDYQKLVAFLELPNGVGKNGDKISENYDPEDPATWDGVVWFNGAEKRVWGIIWSEKGLVGDLDVSDCTELGNIYNYFNQLTSLDVSGCTSLKRLFCSDNQLISLDVSGCTALVILSCSDNQLTMLDVSNCTALEELGCSSNQLTALDVSGLSTLTTLSCKSNLLAELNVSDCTALNSLRCGTNRLTSLDVTGSAILTTLFCDSNQLTSLDVSGLATLTKLSCKSNLLAELNVSDCTALVELVCDSNRLTALEMSDFATLTKLSCASNQLTALDLSGCTALYWLGCGYNKLTSLEVRGHMTLKHLYCYNNQLTSLDVSGCTALEYLFCNSNQLTALDVSGCTALDRLFCYSNQLTFTTLPFFDGTIYTYSPQNQIQVGSGGKVVIGSEIDLSAVSAVNGVDTVFTWYRYGWEIEPATSVNGIFTFEHGFGEQIIYCLMTNATFPELRLGTNKFLLIGPVKPEIVVQPQNITVATGIAAAFSVTATAIDADAGGILSYQWQQSTDGGNSWSDIADAVGNSYTQRRLRLLIMDINTDAL